MSSIKDTPEFDDLKSNFLEDYKSLRLSTSYTEERHVYRAADDGFDSGADATEAILTAQHDKEMEEFYLWAINNWTKTNSGWISKIYIVDHYHTFTELLALFREQNKK